MARVPWWVAIGFIILFFCLGLWQVALINIGLVVISFICISLNLDPRSVIFVLALIGVIIAALCGGF